MAIKPQAKTGLLVIGVLYVVTIGLMLVNFIRAAKPAQPDLAARHIQAKLNEVWRDLQTDEEPSADTVVAGSDSLKADPDHVRDVEISEKEAAEIFNKYFPARGQIIGVNITLVMQILNFGILLLILYGFLWDPMLRFLDERRRTIKRRLDDAEENRKQAQHVLQERQDELARIRRERADVIEQARSMGEQEGDQIVERARRGAQRIVAQTDERIDEQVRAARAALRREMAELASRIAARVLQREVSPEDHDEIIRAMLSELDKEEKA